jgi:hypothetical protein
MADFDVSLINAACETPNVTFHEFKILIIRLLSLTRSKMGFEFRMSIKFSYNKLNFKIKDFIKIFYDFSPRMGIT